MSNQLKKEDLTKPLILSLIIHISTAVAFVLFLILFGGGNGGGGEDIDADSVLIAKPIETTEIEVVEESDLGQGKQRPSVPHDNEKCESFYGGIGVFHQEVLQVFPGYPADLAGIKTGDIILTPIGLIRGEVGTEVEIEYVNAEGHHKVTLIRDKICFKKQVYQQ